MLVPLAFGFPGGAELFVVLLISLLLFSPLVALVYLVLFRREVETVDEDRLADLEAEVAEMRAQLDEQADDAGRNRIDGADGDRTDSADRNRTDGENRNRATGTEDDRG